MNAPEVGHGKSLKAGGLPRSALGQANDLAPVDHDLSGTQTGKTHDSPPIGVHEASTVHPDRFPDANVLERFCPGLADPVEGQTDVVTPQCMAAGNDHVDPQRGFGINEHEAAPTAPLTHLESRLERLTIIDERSSLG